MKINKRAGMFISHSRVVYISVCLQFISGIRLTLMQGQEEPRHLKPCGLNRRVQACPKISTFDEKIPKEYVDDKLFMNVLKYLSFFSSPL